MIAREEFEELWRQLEMKVIKEGKRPEKRIMNGTCNKCGCEVECERGETTFCSDRAGSGYHVTCPTCHNKWLWVKENK